MEKEEKSNPTTPVETTFALSRYIKAQIKQWSQIESNIKMKRKIETIENQTKNLKEKIYKIYAPRQIFLAPITNKYRTF